MKRLSNLFGAYGAIAEQVVEGFLGLVLKSNMSISDLSEVYSEKIDDIIREELRKGLKYVGGVFAICYVNQAAFEMSYELYFQNAKKEWIKKEAKSSEQKMEYLTQEAKEELEKEKKISFEIDPPNN